MVICRYVTGAQRMTMRSNDRARAWKVCAGFAREERAYLVLDGKILTCNITNYLELIRPNDGSYALEWLSRACAE